MVLILAGCSDQKTKVLVPNGDSNFSKRSHYGNYISNEKELQHFIENKMMTKKGIYTNYKKQSYKKMLLVVMSYFQNHQVCGWNI
jgi:hypothetical protein